MEQYSKPLKIFISYAPGDAEEKNQITRYLIKSGNQFEILSNDMISYAPGTDMFNARMNLLDEADVFILLVSDFYLESMNAKYESKEIINKVSSGKAYAICVMLTKIEWNNSRFSKLISFPKYGKPLNAFENKEAVYEQITEALQSLFYLLLNKKALDILQKCKTEKCTILNLSYCNLYYVPPDLSGMDWIEELHLQNNSIRKIDYLDALANLKYLNLANNEITTIENLDGLDNLAYLDLERNRLTEIQNLHNCTNLKTLGVSTNNIQELSGIAHLTSLETLYVARNKISDVSALGKLTNLKRVVLTDNPVISIRELLPLIQAGIPVQLKYALKEKEQGIFIKGCPIADPPVEVIAMGREAIIEHFSKIEAHGDKKLEIIKLILVGNSGVGKTNFSELLQKKKINNRHISTDTLTIQSWRAPFLKSESGNEMMVNIFDFGGQDYYHDLHRLYYSHDTAYVLLWDTITNAYAERKEKLDDKTELIYEDFPIEYWLESIQYNLYGKEAFDFTQTTQEGNKPANVPAANVPQSKAETEQKAVVNTDLSATAPVLVLQNKIDLGEGLLNQAILRAKYPNITAFFNISINEKKRTKILYEVLDACLGKLNLSGRKLIRYQHEIIEKYLESDIAFQVLTLEEFKDKCASLAPEHKNTLDIADAKTIASVLTNIGAVYFDQPARTDAPDEGIIFTRIDELNDLIKKLMNEAKLGGNKGLFNYAQVSDFKYVDEVLSLLVKNNSVIPLENETYLVPHFLPTTADYNVELFAKAFVHCQIRYVYTAYFHKSIVMSLFAKFLGKQNSSVQGSGSVKVIHYWRNGLILSQDTNDRPQMVFINFIKEATACRIEIRTLYPFSRTGLEREIEKELDELNKGWSFSKEVSINSKDFFEVTAMIEQAKNKDFIFQKNNQVFTVNDFKHLVLFEQIPKKLFISYSSKNTEFVKRFWVHLDVLKTAGYIEPWYDRKIEAGAKWDDAIQKEMSTSHLVIFLLSPDFLNTPYIMNVEVKKAREMETAKQCELFFIQLLPSGWEDTELKNYQMMLDPDHAGKKQFYISTPANDEAWKTIVNILRNKIKN